MAMALVTGATGMVGSYIVERLIAGGWRVRALVRELNAGTWLADLGADRRRGDIQDRETLAAAALDCDVIFHAAAAVGPRGAWEPYRLGNVEGTRNVVEVATSAGARMVHVSSTAVYGGDTRWRHTPTDESVVLPMISKEDPYARSKLMAEQLVLEASARGHAWTSVVRPPPMYGRRDRQLVPRVAPILRRGFFPLIGRGRTILTAVHAESVADGAIRAATTDAARGRAYNLTNDVAITVAEFARLAALGLGVELRSLPMPHFVGKVSAYGLAATLSLLGRAHLAPHAFGLLELLTRDNPFTSERARRELGWMPRVEPEIAVPDAFRWWAEHHGSAKATR